MKREHYFTGTPWEPLVGYCRAIKVGNTIHVSGTTATDEKGCIVGDGDASMQTEQIIQNIQKALAHFGASLSDVVRTRIYVRNIEDWQIIGKIHGKYFGEIHPATSMVEASQLIAPEILVEIEAEAIID